MSTNLYNAGGYGVSPFAASVGQRYYPASYYQNLLTSLYRNAPDFNAWLASVLAMGQQIGVFLDSASFAFSIGSARGDQLDRLGTFIGLSRTLPFQPTGGVSPVLSDADYTTLLLARIHAIHWNGQKSSIYNWWESIFPGSKIVIFDQQNMSVVVRISGITSALWQQIISAHLVLPEAEAVQYNYSFGTFPVFGLDQSNAVVAGVDVGELI